MAQPQAETRKIPPHQQLLARKERQDLITTHQLLHLTFHRNKNQHRRAKWWKWLALLRKAVGGLVEMLGEGREDAKSGDGGPAGAGKWEEEWEQRVKYLREWIVPKCFRYVFQSSAFKILGILYPLFLNLMHPALPPCQADGLVRAFNDLTGETQFANLGLVLLGCLARVYHIIGGGGGPATSFEAEHGSVSLDDRLFELERGERVEQLAGTDPTDELVQRNVLRAGTRTDIREAGPDLGEAVPRTELDDVLSPALSRVEDGVRVGVGVTSSPLPDAFTGPSMTSSSDQVLELQIRLPSPQLRPGAQQGHSGNAFSESTTPASHPTTNMSPQNPILLLSPTLTTTLRQASQRQGAASLEPQDQLFQTHEARVVPEKANFKLREQEQEREKSRMEGMGAPTKDGGQEQNVRKKRKGTKKEKKKGNAIDDLFRDVL